MRNKIIASLLILVFALSLFLMGCNDGKIEKVDSGEQSEKTEEATGSSDNAVNIDNIYDRVEEIVRPFYNENGFIEDDNEKIKESSGKVFEYANDLKEKGKILDCTYCDISDTVAFYFDEKTIWLYEPQISGTYGGDGTGEFSVTSVESIGWLDDTVITGVDQFSRFRITGARESAKLIYNTLDRFTTHDDIDSGTLKCMDDVVNWMKSINKNTRAIFWRGHANIFKSNIDGGIVVAWFLPFKYSEDDAEYNIDDESLVVAKKGYCTITANFWKKYCPEVDDCAFITGSCYAALDGGRTANTLFEKGFSAYVAPNGKIWCTYSDKMLGRIAEYLCGKVDEKKYDIVASLAKARNDIGKEDIYGTTLVCENADPSNPFKLIPTDYEVYADLLREKEGGSFALVYVDDDEIAELLYYPVLDPHTDHIYSQIELYTIYNDELAFLDEYLGYGGTFAYNSGRKNMIFSFGGFSTGYYGYGAIKDGKLIRSTLEDGKLAGISGNEEYDLLFFNSSSSYDNNEENIQLMLDGKLDLQQ